MSIAENLETVEKNIDEACKRAGRDRGGVRLMAVSKTFPPECVDEAMRAGQTLFGENRVQEAAAKIPLCGSGAEWHLIGHLQGNKARRAVEMFTMIHSVDSVRLYAELAKAAGESGRRPGILLEVNVSGEASKFGFKPEDVPAALAEMRALAGPPVAGLMTVPPFTDDPEKSRPFFRRLRSLRDEWNRLPGVDLPVLSMGMSGDYAVAVEEGATIVRVGTAIFGKRSSQKRQMSADSDSYASQNGI